MQTQPSFLLEVYGHTKKKIEILASEFLCLTHLQLSVLDTDFGPVQVFVKRNFLTLLDSLRKLLLTTTGENKICYVDFNLDLLRHEQHTITG